MAASEVLKKSRGFDKKKQKKVGNEIELKISLVTVIHSKTFIRTRRNYSPRLSKNYGPDLSIL